MKVQFSADFVRIRLGQEEFDGLRRGQALRLPLPLAARAPVVSVVAGEAFSVRREPDALRVTWPAAALDALADRLPAREGLEGEASWPEGRVRFVLEVDVRSGRPSRPPRGAVR